MIYLDDLAEFSGARIYGEHVADQFVDFCFDSRRVNPGELFVAFKTDHGDGHQYIDEALVGGAAGVLCQIPPVSTQTGITYLVVDDTQAALAAWASRIVRKYGVEVIGVTGSTGKTYTKEAIAAVLSTRFRVFKNPWGFNGRFGLPLALGRLGSEHELAVFEMATDHFGEMAGMVDIVKPKVGVVTDVSEAHIEHFGSLDNIAREKGELVATLPPDGTAVLNADNAYVWAMASRTKAKVVSMSIEPGSGSQRADLVAYNVAVRRDKVGFDLRCRSHRYERHWTTLLGQQRLYCLMAALAVGQIYGILPEECLSALEKVDALPGRLRPLSGVGNCLVVDDTFNATPTSTLAALDWMEKVRGDGGRMIFVMGGMDELGVYAGEGYRRVGERAAQVADKVVTFGRAGAQVRQAAIGYGMSRQDAAMTFTHDDAARLAAEDIGPEDVILVKGSPSSRMERIVRQLLKEPERDSCLLPRQGTAWEQVRIARPERPTWVEIDLDAIANNTCLLKELIGPDVALMAVIKANAYGHGAVQVGATAMLNGAEYLGVASINEAVALRQAGVDAPILVLGYTPAWAARQAILHNIAVTLYDAEVARYFDLAAHELNGTVTVHIKVDTGMGRLGLLPHQVEAFFEKVRCYTRLNVEGIFTHFSVSEATDKSYTLHQLGLFQTILNNLRANGWQFKYIHCANSAAIFCLPETHFTMVRAGIALYGLSPSPEMPCPPVFHPALTWKTTIAQVKTLPPDSFVSYGNTYCTTGTETIAVIPVGYADGFRRAPRTFGEVLVRGGRAPIVGQVCMDQTMINVSHITGVKVGDEVVIIGQQGDEKISAEDVANRIGTINYEAVSEILARVPRI